MLRELARARERDATVTTASSALAGKPQDDRKGRKWKSRGRILTRGSPAVNCRRPRRSLRLPSPARPARRRFRCAYPPADAVRAGRQRDRRHERAPLPDRPAARDAALPARLVQAQHARHHPSAEARHARSTMRSRTPACARRRARRIMSGYFPAQHGVKYTLETDMPTPKYPQVELAPRVQEPGHRHRRGRLHAGLQGEVPLQQARERLDLGPRGRQPVRLHPLGLAGRRRRPEHPGGGRRRLRQ